MIDAVVAPSGVEARAVRRALARVRARGIRLYESAIGARSSERLARELVAAGAHHSVLGTGLCGAARPAFAAGEVLVYGSVRRPSGGTLALDADFARALAGRVPWAQSGIRALEVDVFVARARDKRALAEREAIDALDMESYALAAPLHAAGVRFGVLRVVSDAADWDLPDLAAAVGPSGELRIADVARAFARRPLGGIRMSAGALRATAALERSLAAVLRDH